MLSDSKGRILKLIKILAIALVLMGIALLYAIPKCLSIGEKSPVGAAAGDIGALNSALALYYVDSDSQFPITTLAQLCSDNVPGWAGPYMATITNDPWNNKYTYTSDGTTYTIQSIHESDYKKSETIRYCFGTGVMESLP